MHTDLHGGPGPELRANPAGSGPRLPLVLDMVHHNPGERPFVSSFSKPEHLRELGFDGQVFKHINCVATFAAAGVDVFPAGSPDREWLDTMVTQIAAQIAAAKAQGLRVYYHIDLFVLPRRLVAHFRDEILDGNGRIDLQHPRTLELHRIMFNELFARFADVDGFIIRVGETYLFDTPYHVGNGPIPSTAPGWSPTYLYDEVLASVAPPVRWGHAQAEAYVQLLRFLRAEVCVKHGRNVIFRTWDIFPDRLHARLDRYLEVTDAVEPHAKLIFSIKHTTLDFWRRVSVNPCLGEGRHPQVVEVQCQREYEGKGAFPNYVMAGVIDGFAENEKRIGLRQLLARPQIAGVFNWSRGGGWYGPYIKDELWCELNAYVLARFAGNPGRSEPEIFAEFARDRLRLDEADRKRFRHLCLLSAEAVLKGRYCEAFDAVLRERILPTALWMRDDRLGGHEQLAHVLNHLDRIQGFAAALAERAEAVRLWEEIAALARAIAWPAEHAAGARVSAEYGRLLFAIVHQGWRIMIAGYCGGKSGRYDVAELTDALRRYNILWGEYQALALQPACASLFRDEYFSLPGAAAAPGLGATVRYYETQLRMAAGRA